jgi:hypothetical protein
MKLSEPQQFQPSTIRTVKMLPKSDSVWSRPVETVDAINTGQYIQVQLAMYVDIVVRLRIRVQRSG